MKISIFYQHIVKAAEETGMPVAEVMRILKSEGLEAVEFAVLHADTVAMDALQRAGLSVSSLYEYDSVFNGEIEAGLALVDKAKEIGCRTVMVVPGVYPEDMKKNSAMEKSRIPLQKIAEYGAEKGITVTVEDYDGARTLFDTSADLRLFGDSIPSLYYTFDSGNFFTVENPLLALRTLKSKIRHVHLKDCALAPMQGCTKARQMRSGITVYDVPFGHGVLPCTQILQELKNFGYDGFLCLEHAADAGAMMDVNLAAVRWVKNHI